MLNWVSSAEWKTVFIVSLIAMIWLSVVFGLLTNYIYKGKKEIIELVSQITADVVRVKTSVGCGKSQCTCKKKSSQKQSENME